MKLERGSSPHFTLTAVVFGSQVETKIARKKIKELRASLGRKSTTEFKFNKSGDECKSKFFELASTLEFSLHSFTLRKARLVPGALDEPKRLYRKVTSWTLENLMDWKSGPSAPLFATLVFDSCGDREFYAYFQRLADRLVRVKFNNGARVKVIAQDSRSEDLLQLADMLCGLVRDLHLGKADAQEQFKLFHGKIGTIRVWP